MYTLYASSSTPLHSGPLAPQHLPVIALINVLDTESRLALCHDGFLKDVRKQNFGAVDNLKYGQD